MPDVAPAAPAVPPAAAGGEGEQPAEQGNTWKSIIWRFATMYFMMNVLPGLLKGGGNTTTTPTAGGAGKLAPGQASNMWPTGTEFELFLYASPDNDFSLSNSSLIHAFSGLKMGEWYDGPEKNGARTYNALIPATPELQNNGSLYLHIVAVRNQGELNPLHPDYKYTDVVVLSREWTRFKKRKIQAKTNLLTGESSSIQEGVVDGEIVSYWHPNITISFLDDQRLWSTSQPIAPPFDKWVDIDPETMQYKPILYINDYWDLASDMFPVNNTVDVLPLSITYAPISIFYFQIYEAQKMQKDWNKMFGVGEASEEENDIVKRTMMETNPVILGLTIVVSLIHTVFEFLAFKNDIQFWKSRQSLEGLSVRSILFNIFTQLIVVLYVLDNDTNTMVVISVCVGLVIEFWKITKVMDVSNSEHWPDPILISLKQGACVNCGQSIGLTVDFANPWLGIIPALRIADKSSYAESPTKMYDRLAFKYLSWVLTPLLVGYAIYSLLYEEHRGWYSWTLNMCYGGQVSGHVRLRISPLLYLPPRHYLSPGIC
eukprot:sb/3463676/